jgi:hypothetical protein
MLYRVVMDRKSDNNMRNCHCMTQLVAYYYDPTDDDLVCQSSYVIYTLLVEK